MKRMMKRVLAGMACMSLATLCGCGGESNHYDNGLIPSTLFAWDDGNYAEHPGVEHKGDPGTPLSIRDCLVGKRMTLRFNTNGATYEFIAYFNTETSCTVEATMPAWFNGPQSSAGTYTYTISYNHLDGAGVTRAALAISFPSSDGTRINLWLPMHFTDVFAATAYQPRADVYPYLERGMNREERIQIPVGSGITWSVGGAN